MNKRGWVRIVEAVIAVLLITGVLLIVLDQQSVERKDISSRIYDIEFAVLREIQVDDDFRDEILSAELLGEEANVSAGMKNKIDNRTTGYLECEAKICNIESNCVLEEDVDYNLYTQSVIIAANLETYDPRQLKLFCWEG